MFKKTSRRNPKAKNFVGTILQQVNFIHRVLQVVSEILERNKRSKIIVIGTGQFHAKYAFS